jgi:hypothetical protein
MFKQIHSLGLAIALATVALPAWAARIGTLTATDPNAQINVRSQPTIRSNSPHYGVSGDQVEILKCVVDQDRPNSDLNWCQIRFVQSQATGWVRSDFIIFPSDGE